ncbi:MAG TPA: urease accessory UreF family protein [Casimicrobiaceae bacterium]|nr:urease accessory UreF family protein [Casimicrobiaceae bacterium]
MSSEGPLLPLVRLLQLASPALPIGAYSYSQGLEWVVAEGAVRDAPGASAWIDETLRLVVAAGEAAMLWRLLGAVQRGDWAEAIDWNDLFRASRETAELRAETEQMGGSLVRLAEDLALLDAGAREAARTMAPVTLPAAYALAAHGFALDPSAALAAYVWSWLENQVLCAVKTIPLGQLAGQRLLVELGARVPAAVDRARSIADTDISTFAPGLALASSRHETQYSRLFRS